MSSESTGAQDAALLTIATCVLARVKQMATVPTCIERGTRGEMSERHRNRVAYMRRLVTQYYEHHMGNNMTQTSTEKAEMTTAESIPIKKEAETQLHYTSATATDADAAAYILMMAFEETMGDIFPMGSTPELQEFRKSQILQTLAVVDAFKRGTHEKPTNFILAHQKQPDGSQVLAGLVIYSIENSDHVLADGVQRFTAPPLADAPPRARLDLFLQFRQAMVQAEEANLGKRPHISK